MAAIYTHTMPACFSALYAAAMEQPRSLAEIREFVREECAKTREALRKELKRARLPEKRERLEGYLAMTDREEARTIAHFSSDLT